MSFIKPEIYGTIVTEKFKGRVVVEQLATDLGVLSGNVGDTVSFPMFNKIGDCSELTKGNAISVEELTQSESKATIKQVAKGVRIFDIDDLTALGNFVENASQQQAKVFVRKIDSDLLAECDKTTLKVSTVNEKEITAENLNHGFALFGDDCETSDMAGIVIHSMLTPSFYHMDEFVNANLTHTTQGNGIVQNGCIGMFRGIPVFVSDKGTLDATECKTYIIKKGALGKMYKRGINIEAERKASLKATDLYGDVIYAVKLLDTEGVVMLRKTIA